MNEANHSQGAAGTCRTVLIVDDAESSVTALEMSLSGIEGIRVQTVSSALRAVRMLQDPAMPVSAVITDIHMPVMDGLQLIQFIRADGRHGGIPVIVVTADTDPDTPGRTTRLGANAFFTKPCSPAAVRKTQVR